MIETPPRMRDEFSTKLAEYKISEKKSREEAEQLALSQAVGNMTLRAAGLARSHSISKLKTGNYLDYKTGWANLAFDEAGDEITQFSLRGYFGIIRRFPRKISVSEVNLYKRLTNFDRTVATLPSKVAVLSAFEGNILVPAAGKQSSECTELALPGSLAYKQLDTILTQMDYTPFE